MFIQLVKFKSELSDDRVEQLRQEHAANYQAIKGLIQIYYARDVQTGEFVAVFIWDSEASQRQFRESEIARTIPQAYKVTGQPQAEFFNLVFLLRSEEQTTR